MIKYLMIISIIIAMIIAILLKRNINNKNVKYAILVTPFVLASILYFGISLVSKIMPSNACDGIVIIGIFISFVLLGIGVIFNLINIFHLVMKHK